MSPRKHAPEPMIKQDPMIGFTSKELFLEINRKIDLLTNVANQKADRAEHEKLSTVVDEILRLGSDKGREALQEATELRAKISALERESATITTMRVTEQRLEAAEHLARRQWIGIILTAGLSGLGMALTILLRFIK